MPSASRSPRAPNWWSSRPADKSGRRAAREERHGQVHHRTAFSPAGVGRRGEGLLPRRGARLRVPRADPLDGRPAPQQGRAGRLPEHREGPRGRRELRLPLDGRTSRPRTAMPGSMPTPIRSRRPASSCRPIRRIRTPADLAGVPISVGFQSGSHYSTIQALEQYLPRDQIKLSFDDGMLFRRMELLIDGKSRRRRCSAARTTSPSSSASARSSTRPS